MNSLSVQTQVVTQEQKADGGAREESPQHAGLGPYSALREADLREDLHALRVVCRAHNKLYAEQAFGCAYVEEQICRRQRRSNSPMST